MMTPDERIAYEAADSPSLLDEKKYLEERRRRLEHSLHDHVEDLKDRGREVGRTALIGAAAVAGIWLVSKAIGASRKSKKHQLALDYKQRVKGGALTPGGGQQRQRPAASGADSSDDDARYGAGPAASFAPMPAPVAAYAPPRPEGPSFLQIFLQSDAGKMMSNQLVAIAMVFITKKLQEVLQLPAGADIGTAKESASAPYKIIEPQDATVVEDGAGV